MLPSDRVTFRPNAGFIRRFGLDPAIAGTILGASTWPEDNQVRANVELDTGEILRRADERS